MINEYVSKFIDNLPDEITKSKMPLKIDLVLEGGVFNGSYLVGALYFLKEMEKKNYIKIERISGCSIGSVAAFFYYIDSLDSIPEFYDIAIKQFKETYKLSYIKEIKQFISNKIPDDICQKVNNKFFITYNDISNGVKIVKSYYKNSDEIINTIIKSSYLPIFIDGNFMYEEKFIDGINPFIFETEPDKKILYLELVGYNKLSTLLNIKNEKTNEHRILTGLLDIHNFFIKQTSTSICSYVNDWSLTDTALNYFKILLEKIVVYIIYFIYFITVFIRNNLTINIEKTPYYNFFYTLINELSVLIINCYCL